MREGWGNRQITFELVDGAVFHLGGRIAPTLRKMREGWGN